MDLVVDDNGGLNVNFVVGAKCAKSCVNINLSPAVDSCFEAERRLSTESVYELIEESIDGDPDNEIFNSDGDADLRKNINDQLNGLETSKILNQNGSQDPSNSVEMDEEFVVIEDDDGNDTSMSNVKNDLCEELSNTKANASNCESTEKILKSFAVDGENNASRLSDKGGELESSIEKSVSETDNEEKSNPRVILSSDDDAIDSLLDDFREDSSSDENSVPLNGNTNAASATANEKLKHNKSNDFSIFKTLSTDVNNKTNSSHSDLQLLSKQNSSAGNSLSESNRSRGEVFTIPADEKSNDSNCSSIEIIDDVNDDAKVKSSESKSHETSHSQTTIPKLNSPLKSPSFSSSSEDKFEFDSKILDIVGGSSPLKIEKTDSLHSNSKSNNLSFGDLIENKPNDDSVHNKEDNYFSELSSKKPHSEEKSILHNNVTSAKVLSDNVEQSDITNRFLSCNGSISSSSDISSSSNIIKDNLDSETQDVANSTTKIVTDNKKDNDELIPNSELNVSTKQDSCDENKGNIDSNIQIVDFPTELLIGEDKHDVDSLKVKDDQMDCSSEVESKTNCEENKDVSCKEEDLCNKEPEEKIRNKIDLLRHFESKQSDGQFVWTFHRFGKRKDSSNNSNKKRKPEINYWFRKVSIRKRGKTKGYKDIYYYPNPYVKLRSLNDVKQYCKKEKISFDPEQYDFSPKEKIELKNKSGLTEVRKVITLPILCENILKQFEEAIYNLCEDNSIMAVCEKVEINRSQSSHRIFKIEDNEVKTDIEMKVNSPKLDLSTENKITNVVESEDNKIKTEQLGDLSNKRKLEDIEAEINVKKLKSEDDNKEDIKPLNGDIDAIPPKDLKLINTKLKDDEGDINVLNTVESLMMMLGKPKKELHVVKNSLDQLALCFCVQPWKGNYIEALGIIKLLEDKLEQLNNIEEKYQTKIAECKEFQRNKFTQHSFKSKVPTRTVGVNVKIYRESEIKNAMINATKTKVVRNSVLPDTPTPLPDNKALIPNFQVKDTIISPTVPTTQVMRKPLLPRIITQTTRPSPGTQMMTLSSRMPSPNVTVTTRPPSGTQVMTLSSAMTSPNVTMTTRPPAGTQVMTLSTRMPPPNVTMGGNRFISVGRPPSSVVLVPSSSITTPSNTRFVTEDHKMQKVVTAAAISTTTQASPVAKVMPGMSGNPNVLVPLKDYLQLLPPGSKGTAVIQQAAGSRPTLIPPLPTNLTGARTVTYFVPQNSTLGARGIQQFLPSQNQQVQFVLRVTSPGNVPTLNSVVNTVPRPTIMQPPLATAPRLQPPAPQLSATPQSAGQPAVAQATVGARNSGLILISHTSKHPAPFPKSPHYTENKGKAIPPKPALKGSKNQSGGIVLSWNMNLTNKNANIASYQLFAYQETDGPVDASLWKKVGDVNALPLPMACTLTQFVDKNRYYFTVRAVDVFQRFGPFSDPVSILFEKDGESIKKEK